MLNWFSDNATALVLAGVGILVSICLAWFASRSKKPRFLVRHNILIKHATNTFPNLKIHYKGHSDDLESFAYADVAFWNAGREPIRQDDIAKKDPLRAELVEGVLLGFEPKMLARPANHVSLDKKGNAVLIGFDHLNRGDAVVVRLFHNAHIGKVVKVKGEIVGVGPPKSAVWTYRKRVMPVRDSAKLLLAFGGILLAVLLAIVNDKYGLLREHVSPGTAAAIVPFGGALMALIGVTSVMLLWMGYLLRKPLLPRSARQFDDLF